MATSSFRAAALVTVSVPVTVVASSAELPKVAAPLVVSVVAATDDGVLAPIVVPSIAPPLISTRGIVVVVLEDSVIFAVPELLGSVIVSSSNVLAMIYSFSPFL